MSDKPQHTPNVALLNECLHLRAAMRTALGCLDDPTGGQHVSDMRLASRALREALDAGQQDTPDLLVQVERLTEQRDALKAIVSSLLNRASCDEGWCSFCKKQVGNMLPANDRYHDAACPVLHARAALKGEGDDQA